MGTWCLQESLCKRWGNTLDQVHQRPHTVQRSSHMLIHTQGHLEIPVGLKCKFFFSFCLWEKFGFEFVPGENGQGEHLNFTWKCPRPGGEPMTIFVRGDSSNHCSSVPSIIKLFKRKATIFFLTLLQSKHGKQKHVWK